jgi:hypothetical protein
MPNGTVASHCTPPYDYQYSSAPGQSPLLVTGIVVTNGARYTIGARGAANVGGGNPSTAPGGDAGNVVSHSAGAEDGIADITSPLTALIGVFLGSGQPDSLPAPAALDFSTPASRDFASISPELQQPFFIGTGTNSDGSQKVFVAPANATRLFLGIMDGCNYSDNSGSYTGAVLQVGAPAQVSIALYAGLSIAGTTGSVYRVDYSGTLGPPAWTPLATQILATSPQLYIDTSTPARDTRIYRAVPVP